MSISRHTDPFDGILLVDKPAGPTSHDIVDQIRRHFRFRKTGHGGTLDPQATGLLIILLGKGTKVSNQIMSGDKIYEGTLCLGIATDTQDAEGKILRTTDARSIQREQLDTVMKSFLGDQHQIPPMVSAIKKEGVPLYKLARRGETVEREPKLIHVYEFILNDFTPPLARFTVRCTKGTYVRTLCHDIGEKLGCGAHLQQLRRISSGSFFVEKAIAVDRLMGMNTQQLLDVIIPLHELR